MGGRVKKQVDRGRVVVQNIRCSKEQRTGTVAVENPDA